MKQNKETRRTQRKRRRPNRRKTMSVMERIDLIRANSMTDADYKHVCGRDINESVNILMKSFDEKLEKYKPEELATQE